ncbi:MAG: RluA family pseudouridine synthase [Desulfovibrio sp.]|jgi:23S rRNA pseudouridine955/2504/2580 synthase|nr:RluA family pseudouridine synthase [Desulfovibrio sp.]
METEKRNFRPNALVVDRTESGMKLLRFLERRLSLPLVMLHRWLRTGQVRLNGGRVGAFTRVNSDDVVRLPPFASNMTDMADSDGAGERGDVRPPPELTGHPPDVPGDFSYLSCIGRAGDIWALYKPPGLPTHGGSRHRDSLAARLKARYAGLPFVPTPAHRLDKNTSGTLLVAASYFALQQLHSALRERRVVKEYLAWAAGNRPFSGVRLLRHYLRKEENAGFEKMRVLTEQAGEQDKNVLSREALCLVRYVRSAPDADLLQIRLLTGRTHQIRAQLAACGYPLLGDVKYGGGKGPMRLHALRVIVPAVAGFVCPPPWRGKHAIPDLSEVMPIF